MSTSPIQSSGGYTFPPAELPEDVPTNSSNTESANETTQRGSGSDALRDGPGGLREDMGDRSVPLGTMPGNRPIPGNADQAGLVHRSPIEANNTPPSQPQNPNTGSAAPRDTLPSGGGERAPPADRNQGPGADPRIVGAPDGKPNAGDPRGPGNQQSGPVGNNAPGQNNGNGYGQNAGSGNSYGHSGSLLGQLGNSVSSLLGGLLGNNPALRDTLPSLISSQSLSQSTLGGVVNSTINAPHVPTGLAQVTSTVLPNTSQNPATNTVATPVLSTTHQASQSHTTQIANSALPMNTLRSTTTAQPTIQAGSSSNAQPMPLGANTTLIARPTIAGPATDTAHSTVAAGSMRGVTTDLPVANNGVSRGQTLHDPVNAIGTQAANSQANATRQNAQVSIQAVTAQTSLLTLVMSPQVQAGYDEGGVTHMALFRGQNAEGQESIRDILGRSYVFNAEGKLVTRAEERRSVDAIGTREANEISESSASNHGELSTHDLVWKVVTPALIGVGALLGGTTASAAAAAGSGGIASAFLLTAATAIFGYGALRAGLGLRSMADAGQVLNPFSNPVASKQWIAAGTQSVGSLASLIALIV